MTTTIEAVHKSLGKPVTKVEGLNVWRVNHAALLFIIFAWISIVGACLAVGSLILLGIAVAAGA